MHLWSWKPLPHIRGIQRLIIFLLSSCNNQLSQMFTWLHMEWIDYWINNYLKIYLKIKIWIIDDSKIIFINTFSPFPLKKLRLWHIWLWLIWTTIIYVYAMTIYHQGHNNWQKKSWDREQNQFGGVFKASPSMIT
jgi:hypothetical protein